MPNKRSGHHERTQAERTQAHLLWEQTGSVVDYEIGDWDCKPGVLEAILAILSTGSAVFLRPGSGGRAVGIAVWEGDTRHAPKWVYDASELDDWAEWVRQRAEERKVRVKPPTSA